MAKQIPNFISNKKLFASQMNAMWKAISGDKLLGIDQSTRLPKSLFDIGDLTEISGGSMVNDMIVRNTGSVKAYDSSPSLISSKTWQEILAAGGGGGDGGGLNILALKSYDEKNGKLYNTPSAKSIVQSFIDDSTFQIWPRRIYDASVDTTTMYLDHGLDTELETQNDFETVGDFTSAQNTPTVAADTSNFIEGTQSIKMTKAALNGQMDMYDTVTLGLFARNFRTSFYPDTLANVVRAFITLYTSAGNTATYYFSVANMTALQWHNFTVDLNTTPDVTVGTFNKSQISRIYYGFETSSAQTVNVSWDLSRIISDKPLLNSGYSLELPIQDTVNQEIVSIQSVDATDSSKFTIAAQLTNDYPDGLSKANLDNVYISTQTGTIANNSQAHKSTASGQNAKTAITSDILLLAKTIASMTLESYTNFLTDAIFEVNSFPTTATLKLASDTDLKGFFLDDDYIILYKKARVTTKEQIIKGTASDGFKYLQLNADATFSSSEISLSHDGSNDVGTDKSDYYVIPSNVIKKYVAGSKTESTIVTMEPKEIIVYPDVIQYPTGLSAHWTMDEASGDLLDSKNDYDLARQGSPVHHSDGIFDSKGAYTFPSGTYFRNYYADFINTQGTSTNCTFECWIKFSNSYNSDNRWLFGNMSSGYISNASSLYCAFTASTRTLRWGTPSNNSTVDTTSYADGKWHHLCCVVRNSDTTSKKRIYIDGVSVGTVNNAGDTYVDADGYVAIASTTYSNQTLIYGTVDEAAYWHSTAATEDQIKRRFNNGIGRRYSTEQSGGITLKYKKEGIASGEKISIFDYNKRSDTVNQNPKIIEINSIVY